MRSRIAAKSSQLVHVGNAQLLTCQAGYDSLLTHSVPFANAAAELPTLICDTADALCIAIDYTAED